MISVLAPSKTMDFSLAGLSGLHTTKPPFIGEAERIVATIRAVDDEAELAKLMHVSPTIARAVRQKYDKWGKVTKPSVFAYAGDIYKGFRARTLTLADVNWAQDHLLIVSGVYGVVRPLDEISAYRLEMKTRLSVDETSDLYAFWGEKLARFVDARADGIICNIASDEYGKVVTKYAKSRIVTPVFYDKRPGGNVATVPIYSKMMRGVMARWIIDNRVDDPKDLENFVGEGYAYDAARSKEDQPAFYREYSAPISW